MLHKFHPKSANLFFPFLDQPPCDKKPRPDEHQCGTSRVSHLRCANPDWAPKSRVGKTVALSRIPPTIWFFANQVSFKVSCVQSFVHICWLSCGPEKDLVTQDLEDALGGPLQEGLLLWAPEGCCASWRHLTQKGSLEAWFTTGSWAIVKKMPSSFIQFRHGLLDSSKWNTW